MKNPRPFAVVDVVRDEGVRFEHGERVEFEAEPPIFQGSADRGGGAYRLIPDEGSITVTSEDGGIYVSGRHAITIEPRGANSVMIRLLDSREATEVEPAEPTHTHNGVTVGCAVDGCQMGARHDHWPDGSVTRRFR